MESTAHRSGKGMLVEHSKSRTLKVTGADALSWLQGMVTQDVLGTPSVVQRGLCLDRLGKVQAEVLSWKQPGDLGLRLTVCGGDAEKLREHLCRYIIMEDVSIEYTAEKLYSVHGSPVDSLLSKLATPVRVGTLTWLTILDMACLVEPELEAEFLGLARQLGLESAKASDWDAWRIAAGLPEYGIDYDGADTPAIAGLVGELVSSSKGCYLGQEVVCRTQMRGAVRQQVVRMQLEAESTVGAAVRLASNGEAIGKLTSVASIDDATAVPRGVWGMARVKHSSIDDGTDVLVDAIAGRICPRTQLAPA